MYTLDRNRQVLPQPRSAFSWDILLALVPFVPANSLRAYMNTCRTLHSAAAPYLVLHQLHNGTQRGLRHLAAFCRFVLKENHRARLIQELRIGSPDDHYLPDVVSRVYDQLAHVLERTTNLKSLFIDDADRIFVDGPRLGPAICSLKHITRLELNGVGECTQKALSSLSSPVTSVDISYADPDEAPGALDDPDPDPPHPQIQSHPPEFLGHRMRQQLHRVLFASAHVPARCTLKLPSANPT
ncbi:hypothetical protein EUX98_g7235 [Antrodiella citrinella]|uniref:F-box domain-containing protein n=1 Tax=Antrodiella citrinella TaxID=2447956 RepID=A0A4S4MPH8_9APHY|nr:hypothetical protein EUX98_g7235 [Antrodiella citrinella]